MEHRLNQFASTENTQLLELQSTWNQRARGQRSEKSINHGQREAAIVLQILQNSVHPEDPSSSFCSCPAMATSRSAGWKCCHLLLEANDVTAAAVLKDDTDLFPYQQHHLQRRCGWLQVQRTLCWLPIGLLVHVKQISNVRLKRRKQPQVQLSQPALYICLKLILNFTQAEPLESTVL